MDVVIEARDACSNCKAKDICGSGAGEEKVITVYTDFAAAYRVGEEVAVSMEQVMGMKAVSIAYIFPFFIVLGTLLIMLKVGIGELVSGLTALGMLAVYYLCLYVLRDRIEKEIVFRINKIYE